MLTAVQTVDDRTVTWMRPVGHDASGVAAVLQQTGADVAVSHLLDGGEDALARSPWAVSSGEKVRGVPSADQRPRRGMDRKVEVVAEPPL